MKGLQKPNSQGFGLIGTLLVIVLICLLSFGGWYVYHNHKAKTVTTSSRTTQNKGSRSAATTSDPYAGWKSSNLKYEQVTFRYPASWQLSNTSIANGVTGIVSPGSDQAAMTSPDGLTVSIKTGVTSIGDGIGANQNSFYSSKPISLLGSGYYLDVTNQACVGTLPTVDANWPYSKNIQTTNGTGNKPYDVICIALPDSGSSTPAAGSITSDPSYNDAKLVVESLTYQP